MSEEQHRLEVIELDLLLEAIYRAHGYDFRQYARASLRRRFALAMQELGEPTLTALQGRVLRDDTAFHTVLNRLSVTVTEMFRDPPFFKALREEVLPVLDSYPYLKVWIAGCATGEEVYSLGILFKEEGLYERTRFYATDINQQSLKIAKEGIYPVRSMAANTQNYHAAGGRGDFSDYYTAGYESLRISEDIRGNMVFSHHNLASDGIFNEMNLIVCRNVLIYFNKALQKQVLQLFHDSLSSLGYLGLGSKETVRVNGESLFDEVIRGEKLFRKRA
jgi:chemotaxis protein methyltransferase CheR